MSLLEGHSNTEYAADWSRLNIYRRHFESSCGIPTTAPRATEAIKPIARLPSNGQATSITSTTTTPTPSKPSTTTPASTLSVAPKLPPAAVLQYQPKAFLASKEPPNDPNQEFVEDDDDLMISNEEGVITNTTQPAMSASLDAKIRGNGHIMGYIERTKCRFCERMTAKQCEKCRWCVKCAQRNQCKATGTASIPSSTPDSTLSVTDRNVQVLSSAMDQAVYKAFKEEDFYSVFSLIQNGMDVNYQRVESDGSTALMAAAYHGREDAVNKLLSLGANPCLIDASTGKTASGFAQQKGHLDLAEKLKQAAETWKSK